MRSVFFNILPKFWLFLLKQVEKSIKKECWNSEKVKLVCNDLCLVEYIFDRIIDESESSRQKNKNRSSFSNLAMI